MGKTVNVILKDKNGEAVTYTGIDTVKLPTDTGEAASFTLGGGGGSAETMQAPVFRLETTNSGAMRIALQGGSYLEKEIDTAAVAEGVGELVGMMSGGTGGFGKLVNAVDKKLLGTLFGKLKANLGNGVRYPKYLLHLHIPAASVRAMADNFSMALPGLTLDDTDSMMDKLLDAWNGSSLVVYADELKEFEDMREFIPWLLEIVPELIAQGKDFLAQPDALEALDLALPSVPASFGGILDTALAVLAQPGMDKAKDDIPGVAKAAAESILSGFGGSFLPKVLARRASGELAALDAVSTILSLLNVPEDTLTIINMIVGGLLSTPGVCMEIYAMASDEGSVPSEKSNAVTVSRAVLEYGGKFAQSEIFGVGGEVFSDNGVQQAKGKLVFGLEKTEFAVVDEEENRKNTGATTTASISATGSSTITCPLGAEYWNAKFRVNGTGTGSSDFKITVQASEGAVAYLYGIPNRSETQKNVLDIARAGSSGSLVLGADLAWNSSDYIYYYLKIFDPTSSSGTTVKTETVTSLTNVTTGRGAVGLVQARNTIADMTKIEDVGNNELFGELVSGKFTGTVTGYGWNIGDLSAFTATDDNGVYVGVYNMNEEKAVKAKLLDASGTVLGKVKLTGVSTDSESAGEGAECKDITICKLWPLAGAEAKADIESCTLVLDIGEKTEYKAFARMGGNALMGIWNEETVNGVYDDEAETVTLDTVQNGWYTALTAEPEPAEKPVLRFVIEQDAEGNVTNAGLEDTSGNEGVEYVLYAGGKPVYNGIDTLPGRYAGVQNFTAAAYAEDKLISAQSEPVEIGVYHLKVIFDEKPDSSELKTTLVTLYCVQDPVVKTSEGESALSGEQWVMASKEKGSSTVSWQLLENGKFELDFGDTVTAELKKAVCASRCVLDDVQSGSSETDFPDGVNLLPGAKAYTGSGARMDEGKLVIEKLKEDVFLHFVLTEKAQETQETQSENAETADGAAE